MWLTWEFPSEPVVSIPFQDFLGGCHIKFPSEGTLNTSDDFSIALFGGEIGKRFGLLARIARDATSDLILWAFGAARVLGPHMVDCNGYGFQVNPTIRALPSNALAVCETFRFRCFASFVALVGW